LTTAYAPGKVILFGEHAVVYGRPAIAVPVTQVRACAVVESGPSGQGLVVRALDLGLEYRLGVAVAVDHPAYPLEVTVRNALRRLGTGTPSRHRPGGVEAVPDLTLTMSSTVPMARGLGSGAALAAAVVRALFQHFGCQLTPVEVSELVYQTEVIHHGTPSGIDNTVIAYEQPVYFVKGQPIDVLDVGRPFWLAIGDTGVASPTRIAVGDVRQGWQQNPVRYEALFDGIGAISRRARQALVQGEIDVLGALMNENQELLEGLGVSSPELEALIRAARQAGALGAKLCGAGRGGNMIALVEAGRTKAIATALRRAGAEGVIVSKVALRPASS
jgi:mevalonate kinase